MHRSECHAWTPQYGIMPAHGAFNADTATAALAAFSRAPGHHGGLDITGSMSPACAAAVASDYGIMSAPPCMRRVQRYLIVNGYDRNWEMFPSRYSFRPDLKVSDAGFKNIVRIAATRLIIPREIVEVKGIRNDPKQFYRHSFGLPHPYLILNIAEFQNIYKASNDASSRAFCHFVYDSDHVTPNGRSYIFLKPMQAEAMTFDHGALGVLDSMTLSVLQPGGTLLNESKDAYKVYQIGYEARNQDMLTVTLVNFFDRNEFYEGDTVRFKDLNVIIDNIVGAPTSNDNGFWRGLDRMTGATGAGVAYLVPSAAGLLDDIYADRRALRSVAGQGAGASYSKAVTEGWATAVDSRGRECVCVWLDAGSAGFGPWPMTQDAAPGIDAVWEAVASGASAAKDSRDSRAALGLFIEAAWRQTVVQDRSHAEQLNIFMNRPEGHRIEMTGTSDTAETLVQNFFIKLPGEWNDQQNQRGIYVSDEHLKSVIDAFNRFCNLGGNKIESIGRLINMSLQVAVSFCVDVEEPGNGP